MEFKTDALVLKATDYKENDKLLTLFTPSKGKVTAGSGEQNFLSRRSRSVFRNTFWQRRGAGIR